MLDQQEGGETEARQRRALADWLRANGRKVPAKVQDQTRAEPAIDADLMPVWSAFWQLVGSRQVGMAAGAIPWSELSRWCEDHEIGGEDRRRWCRLLSAMDLAWLSRVNRRAKRDDTGA
ncbi:MAG: hypothetical protein WAT39_07035 [Planctomycetota bacterium]